VIADVVLDDCVIIMLHQRGRKKRKKQGRKIKNKTIRVQ
jgi:hypothetical protein